MTDDDPGAGDPAVLRVLARWRSDAAESSAGTVGAIRGTAAGAGTWTGAAADAFVAAVPSLLASAIILEAGLRDHATALDRYAAGLTEIQEDQREVLRQRAVAQDACAAHRSWLIEVDELFHQTAALFPPDPDRLTAVRRQRDRLEEDADVARRAERRAEDALDELRARRAALDRAFVTALHTADDPLTVVQRHGADVASPDLVALLAVMTPEQVDRYARAHRVQVRAAFAGDPDAVRRAWELLAGGGGDGVRTALLVAMPAFFGALDGIPVEARVAANREVAARRITRLDRERDELLARGDRDDVVQHRLRQIASERRYLERVVGGTRRAYLLDIDHSRVIEVMGTPSATTRHVITYVPGTFTNLDAVYRGGIRDVGAFLHGRHEDDSVVFVYKDGPFPGVVEPDGTAPGRGFVIEANDPRFALRSGAQLASFGQGIAADPMLASARSTAIGHSWGLANVTASEVAGAHYDAVVSLSGAGMPLDWRPDPDTEYHDYSYNDVLQVLQVPVLDAVWQGVNPRHEAAFAHGAYYRSPADEAADATTGFSARVEAELGALTSNHALVATKDPANRPLLIDLDREVLR